MITVVLITSILLAAVLVGIIFGASFRAESVPSIMGWILCAVGVISLTLWLVLSPMIYFRSFNTVQEMEAFYHDTQSAYEYTISATEKVVIDPSKTRGDAITDFSYQEQGQAVSNRIKEFRNRISWYNEQLRKLRGRNDWPLLGALFADVSEDLKPIRLEAR